MSVEDQYDAKIQWARKHPTLCIDPYLTLDVRAEISGPQVLTCCCNLSLNTFTPEPGPDPFAVLKQQQIDGIWPKDCSKCQEEESHGGTSERVRTILGQSLDTLEQFALNPESTNFELRVKFSNVCTLACRSCTPTDSSTWARIGNLSAEVEWRSNDLADDPAIWEFITDYIKENRRKYDNFYVHLMGGEPLVQSGAKKLMAWIIEQGFAKEIGIRLTTSLSPKLTLAFADYFSQFKSVSFGLSIDSVGENYHLVRWPGKFSRVESNLLDLVLLKNTLNLNWKFNLSPVFSLNNIFYIRDYLDYWHNWSAKHQIELQWANTNLVMGTQFIDVQALPIKYRSALSAELTGCIEHPIFKNVNNQAITMYSFLVSTIKELQHWPEDLNLWDMYLEFTAEFDARTDTMSTQLNRRLFELLDNSDKLLFEQKCNNVDTTKKLLPRNYLLQQAKLNTNERTLHYKRFVNYHKKI